MNYLDNPDIKKAGLIIIGSEILSGRTLDKNTNWIAQQCVNHGIALIEVRVVPDVEETVIRTIHEMSAAVDYVFTTGGIGPTHDDITAACVAKAFDVELALHEEAYQTLLEYYGSEEEVTEARKKMAFVPVGASLIPNPVSGAPGFVIGNVHVMAGVPRIMQAMFDHLLLNVLKTTGQKVFSNSLECACAESEISAELGVLQDKFPSVEIGSYPRYRAGRPSVCLVLRSADKADLVAATRDVVSLAEDIGGKDGVAELELQVPLG